MLATIFTFLLTTPQTKTKEAISTLELQAKKQLVWRDDNSLKSIIENHNLRYNEWQTCSISFAIFPIMQGFPSGIGRLGSIEEKPAWHQGFLRDTWSWTAWKFLSELHAARRHTGWDLRYTLIAAPTWYFDAEETFVVTEAVWVRANHVTNKPQRCLSVTSEVFSTYL